MIKSKVHEILSELNQLKWSGAVKGILVGLISGLLVVLYRLGIEYGYASSVRIFSYLRLHPLAIVPWVGAAVGLGLFIAWLVKKEPMASGSGIPQVEGQVLYGLRLKWYSILAVRFIAGLMSSLFGVSLGREGPSIQIGASGGQAVAKKISRNKLEENYLITGGAAAGLAAAFNAPLSGIVFALEEVHRSFSPLILIAATTASLTADVVSKYFFGLTPVLDFRTVPQLPEAQYFWLIPLGILAGLVGALLNKSLLRFQLLYRRLPRFMGPAAALLLTLPCGLFLPQILGGGANLINIAENVSSGAVILLVFAVTKLVFTCTSFGSGIPGGIFMPILSVGALSGSLFGMACTHLGLPPAYIADFAVCGMAGALSGSVKAPITSILLTAEMTGSLVHLLPVAACSFVALFVSDFLKVTPIYEALLERIIETNEDTIKNDKVGGLVEIPVELGCAAAGKRIGDIDLPEGTLIVNIHRGSKDIVPGQNTVIAPGDYLVLLSSESSYADLHLRVRELCHSNAK
ncbi:H+/Cl-antiporter ClcA [Sporobacter termitidis DSM 10068]|uniref:H+/Cl-antiporter ClcA n=1 Tax=Sporobacter termitidis DSM 10068 TaxID=1123282 RepID=A0A1M5XJ76_9FIRM|nr:ClC family H(+)/Cl(-) exchange transporter [Sporobacter termitidis]SHH99598.1 H+/Cl-antiporter ClcA [Sporobacter termitidis DSM 10068]